MRWACVDTGLHAFSSYTLHSLYRYSGGEGGLGCEEQSVCAFSWSVLYLEGQGGF